MDMLILADVILDGKLSDIVIKGNRILSIAPCGKFEREGAEVFDCAGKVAVPGFVNMHTHAGMSMMRGVGEDILFHEWLDRIWKVEAGIDADYVYHATRMACLEMIKTGTTTFNDHYWHLPMAYKASSELGLRSVLSYVICDRNDPEESERQKIQCEEMYMLSKEWGELSTFAVAVHAIYSVSEPMLLWTVDFARQRGLKIHIHVSETEKEVNDCIASHGVSPVAYLDRLGVLGPDVIAAHTLWLSDEDVRILGERGVTCVHNINSNLKLSSGYRFLYDELRDSGANVCLGTDGCASSNNLDMLETMKTSAMVQKAWRGNPSAMPIDELMDMATANAGKGLGLDIGRIEEGMLADILLVDTDSYHFVSPGTFEANLIYSAHSDCIDTVICNGRFLMKNRIVPQENDILECARRKLNF